MKLSTKQQEFTIAIARLILFAKSRGYDLTFGNAYMKKGSNDGRSDYSTHRKRLAVDFNLFVNGKYITSSNHKAWKILHDFWKTQGGSKIIKRDANHFSMMHNGYR